MKNLSAYLFLFAALWLFGKSTLAEENKLPQDISAFSNKVEMCLHFSGEEPYDRQRAKELERNVKKYCRRLKQQNQQLRQKYAKNPHMIRSLDEIEKKYNEGFGAKGYYE